MDLHGRATTVFLQRVQYGNSADAKPKSIYNAVSPLVNSTLNMCQKVVRVMFGRRQGPWLVKRGDCEDYAVLAASLAVKNGINSSTYGW